MRTWNFDFNAGGGVDLRVVEAMRALPAEADANPHSPHRLGRAAASILEGARERVAAALGVQPAELVFTSGGTEANNLAVSIGRSIAAGDGRVFAASPFEHPSIAVALEGVEAQIGVRWMEVDREGIVTPASDPVGFATVLLAHHELGVVQDIELHASAVHSDGGRIHSDLSQALGRLPLSASIAALDYATLSPHKAGGPRGIGILFAKAGAPFLPLLQGGTQELGRRPGTQSPRLAAGAALAIELAVAEWPARAAGMRAALDRVLEVVDEVGGRVVCPNASHALPNTRTVCFAPIEARHLLPALDVEGVLVSYGSACSSGALEPSPSLLAIGESAVDAACSLRFSVGANEDPNRVSEAMGVLRQVLKRLARFAL